MLPRSLSGCAIERGENKNIINLWSLDGSQLKNRCTKFEASIWVFNELTIFEVIGWFSIKRSMH
jgi:hypothetical protein